MPGVVAYLCNPATWRLVGLRYTVRNASYVRRLFWIGLLPVRGAFKNWSDARLQIFGPFCPSFVASQRTMDDQEVVSTFGFLFPVRVGHIFGIVVVSLSPGFNFQVSTSGRTLLESRENLFIYDYTGIDRCISSTLLVIRINTTLFLLYHSRSNYFFRLYFGSLSVDYNN